MNVRLLLGAALLVGLATARPLAAQEASPPLLPSPEPAPSAPPAEPPAEPQGELPSEEGQAPLADRVSRHWFELRELLGRGDAEGAEHKLDDLRKLRLETGVRGFPNVARALVLDGFRALDAEDPETASARFNAALELDPDVQEARLGLAAVRARGSRLNPVYLVHALRGALGNFAALRSVSFAASGWILVAAAGLLGAGILSVVALVWSRQALLRHDVEEWLKRRVDGEWAKVGAWLVLLLPLLLTFDLYWAALWWAVGIAAYLGLRERVVLAASVLLCGLAVPALGVASRLLESQGDPYVLAATAYLDGIVDAATRRQLERYAADHPEETEAQILLALAEERDGRPREAIRRYRQLAARGRDALILNNIGNVYYRLDEKDKAFEWWKQALDVEPGYAPTHYNLSVYYFDAFEFDRKTEHFEKAKQYDPRLVERWLAEGQGGVVDGGIDRDRVRRRIWSGGPEGAGESLRAALLSPQALGAVVALAAALGLAQKRRAAGVAAACGKCGEPFCAECKPGKERQDYCLQCVHLFIRKDGVSPQLRSDKIGEIGRNQTRRRLTSMLLSLLAPGAGHLYRQRPLAGFAALLLWGLGLAVFALGWFAFQQPGFVARAAQVAPLWVGLALAAAVWVAMNAANATLKD